MTPSGIESVTFRLVASTNCATTYPDMSVVITAHSKDEDRRWTVQDLSCFTRNFVVFSSLKVVHNVISVCGLIQAETCEQTIDSIFVFIDGLHECVTSSCTCHNPVYKLQPVKELADHTGICGSTVL
jgi:hypothetical protein